MKNPFLAAAFLAATTLYAPAHADDKIFILGALHGLHESEDSFNYTDLKAIIKRIAPDVMVLEVRPDELLERKDTPGRPEYPAVIWPMIDISSATMVAMEPGGEDFKRMVGKAGAAFDKLGTENPSGATFLRNYRHSLEAALVAYWQTPAMSQNAVTADLTAGYARVQLSYLGAGYEEVQDTWDHYMADVALETANANPNRRILVLASFRNRHLLANAIAASAPDRVVDMTEWLRQNEGR